MRHAIAPLTIIGVGSLLLIWLLCSAPAPGGPAPAHAAVLASVETTAPAGPATVKLALRQYRAASRARAEWARAKRCLSEPARLRVAGRPPRAASAAVWLQHAHRWSAQRRDFSRRTAKLVVRMTHPGGSSCGSRWAPLLRWLRYPESIIPTFVYIIQRESSGRVRAVNSSSGCAGLLQFQPAWYRGQWGYPAFDPFDPEENLKAGLWLYRKAGLSPWAL